jgi:hypothetical protein
VAGSGTRLTQLAIYYPYIHFRDPRWLKAAALYWPRMVRIVHPDYPTRNSRWVLSRTAAAATPHRPSVLRRKLVG